MAETATAVAAAPPRQLGNGRQLGTLIVTQLKLLLRARKTRALFVVQMLPVVAALVYVWYGDLDGMTMFSNVAENVTIPFLIPLAAIFFGGPAIVEEMEGRTLTYLTLRPIPKPTLFLGKAIAGIGIAVPLVVLPLLMLFGVSLLQSDDLMVALENLGPMLGAVALGTMAYTAVFSALGAAFASGLLASIIYFVVFEMVLGALPILELTSLRYHIRTTAGVTATDRLGFLDKLVLDEPIVLEWWLGATILGIVAVAALGAGSWIFRERQYYV